MYPLKKYAIYHPGTNSYYMGAFGSFTNIEYIDPNALFTSKDIAETRLNRMRTTYLSGGLKFYTNPRLDEYTFPPNLKAEDLQIIDVDIKICPKKNGNT